MAHHSVISFLKKNRVAVLKGGWSKERTISLKTGQAVETSLKRLRIPFYSVDVRKDVIDVLNRKKVQFCFNCLHGPFGEDGQIQNLLELNGIQFTGSNSLASALAMNKAAAKSLFRRHGLPTPASVTVHQKNFQTNPAQAMANVFSKLGRRSTFVKPVNQGSAIGISKVKRPDKLKRALTKCFQTADQALVEELISGRELTVGILGKKTLPVIEIVPQHDFYDFYSKYAKGGSRHILPAPITKAQTRKAKQLAQRAFAVLGCEVYGRVDFMMKRNGAMSLLEVNTIPGMTSTSLLPEAAKQVGIDFDDLVLEMAKLSLKKRKLDKIRFQ